MPLVTSSKTDALQTVADNLYYGGDTSKSSSLTGLVYLMPLLGVTHVCFLLRWLYDLKHEAPFLQAPHSQPAALQHIM